MQEFGFFYSLPLIGRHARSIHLRRLHAALYLFSTESAQHGACMDLLTPRIKTTTTLAAPALVSSNWLPRQGLMIPANHARIFQLTCRARKSLFHLGSLGSMGPGVSC